MEKHALYFTAKRRIEIRPVPIPRPASGELLIQTQVSAISPGTEMLIYRGEAPSAMATDESLPSLAGLLQYPLQYGYACAGQVIEAGDPSLTHWVGKRVFSFQPHQTCFLASPDHLIPVPDGLSPEQAVFLPNMETAVNFVMDGQPLIGERVAVFGQGIVGLLTTSLLAQFPLETLVGFDRFPLRREASVAAGAGECFDGLAGADNAGSFDLVYELTGSPAALDDAIAAAGFDGRVVIGSWYGEKRASLDLGGHFHRSRIRLISSQVSTLSPQLSGRWDKARRFDIAWKMIRRVQPERWITHRLPFFQAQEAFKLLDQSPEHTIQVILTYDF